MEEGDDGSTACGEPTREAAVASAAPGDLTGKSVWVVDANSLIFQVFHALPEMTGPRGEPVSAVFGFARDLLAVLDEKRPDFLFVAFDRPEPTFRHELFAGYKGQRAEMPVDLAPQFAMIERLVAAMNLPVLSVAGYEADDLLATLADQTERRGGDCFLITADKDCWQLVSDHVKVVNLRKNQVLDAAALAEDWGIRPNQVVDFQALVGDSVDNIPGVPLVGPKVAAEWLGKFGTIEELLARADELPKGKRKENLLAGREQLFVSRELARLKRDVPLEIDWSAGAVRGVNREELLRLFREWGLRSLAQRYGEAPPAGSAPAPQPAWQADYRTVDTPEKFAEFLRELRRQPVFSVDTETTHILPRWAEIVGYSFAWSDGVGWYLPVRAPEGEPRLDPQATLAALRPILEDSGVGKVGQNLKYDMVVLRSAGARLANPAFDTMIADYLLEAGERSHNLDELARRYLDHTTIKISELIGTGKQQQRMDEVPVSRITDYAAEDADVAWRLRAPLAARLAETGLEALFHDVEVPLIEVLVEMEYNGIAIDVARLRRLSVEYAGLLEKIEADIYDLAGRPLNIDSPKQLQQVLFNELKLPVLKKTKTGGSTDAEVLEELAALHPLPAKIIEYRQIAKLKGTYVDALPELVHPQTGRVHASFNQVVAATGRLSCNEPNLQNIPVRSERGREIRAAFRPGPPGWRLLSADYSQIELRVLAHFSADPALCEAFARDEDIHARVAGEVAGVPLELVSESMRRQAKAVNFGVIYGQSPFGLAKQLGISQEEAARFIDAYFQRYAGVERFLNGVIQQCQRQGYVSTILGRRRAIAGVRSGAGRQRSLPERTAINTVIQGSAADLIKLAMLRVHRAMQAESLRGKLLLQVHDELVFESPPEEVDVLARLVEREMSQALALAVPLKVDVSVGENWSEMDAWTG